jgi:ribosome-associated heat shock protein Hsp15
MTGVRLDKWLCFARLARTRSLAARLCAEGAVTVSGATVVKPGHLVRIGDPLTVRQGRYLRRVTILGLGVRRGPPTEARLLYEETLAPVALRAAERAAWEPLLENDTAEKR